MPESLSDSTESRPSEMGDAEGELQYIELAESGIAKEKQRINLLTFDM
jgi:hypothetical protein